MPLAPACRHHPALAALVILDLAWCGSAAPTTALETLDFEWSGSAAPYAAVKILDLEWPPLHAKITCSPVVSIDDYNDG